MEKGDKAMNTYDPTWAARGANTMKLKWYHRVRLIRLADKLEGKGPYAAAGPVPAHKFDMRYITQACQGGAEIIFGEFNPHECHTAACAIGWAKSDPWFNDRLEFGVPFSGPSGFNYLFQATSYEGQGGRRVKPAVVAARLREMAMRE